MIKIHLILGSTREGRRGEKVFSWLKTKLINSTETTFEFIDLLDWRLPYLDEPLGEEASKARDALSQKWLLKIAEADGYIFVIPEYNHGYSGVFKNALDYGYEEWNKKPVAFVSYGGVAGGARSTEQLRQVAVELQMAPIRDAVHITQITRAFDENGVLKDDGIYSERLSVLFGELMWWARALKNSRKADHSTV